MNSFDHICITASFYYAIDNKFKCEEKIEEYARKSNYEKAKMLIQTANGCGVIHDKIMYQVDNVGYHSCFCTFKHPYFYNYLYLFKNYERGILPFSGSLTEQPAYIIEIFTLLENLKADRELEEHEKEMKRNNK